MAQRVVFPQALPGEVMARRRQLFARICYSTLVRIMLKGVAAEPPSKVRIRLFPITWAEGVNLAIVCPAP